MSGHDLQLSLYIRINDKKQFRQKNKYILDK